MIQAAKLSLEDYHRIVETGIFNDRSIELLEGELIELSPETPFHANRNNKLFKYLLSSFNDLADVRSSHPITLSTSEPSPDLVLAKLPETLYDERHPTPEDIYEVQAGSAVRRRSTLHLVIEISYSTLDYDLNQKKQAYANAGIIEYWVVDLENHRLIIFREPSENDYRTCTEFRAGDVSTLAFLQIKLAVEKFFS